MSKLFTQNPTLATGQLQSRQPAPGLTLDSTIMLLGIFNANWYEKMAEYDN